MNHLNHLAIIMDGNSRWAADNFMPKIEGHRKGSQVANATVKNVIKHGVKNLTLYAFSSENWHRPVDEINYLIKLTEYFIDQELINMHDAGIRLIIVGDIANFPDSLRKKMLEAVHLTKDNQILNLYIAFGYGGRDEIVHLCKKIIASGVSLSEIGHDLIRGMLYAPDMPDVDLLIRTGGDKRISNFLPWHLSYSELLFLDKYWPDFDEQDLIRALEDFKYRRRNFGKSRYS